jgi:hypothetical protein
VVARRLLDPGSESLKNRHFIVVPMALLCACLLVAGCGDRDHKVRYRRVHVSTTHHHSRGGRTTVRRARPICSDRDRQRARNTHSDRRPRR